MGPRDGGSEAIASRWARPEAQPAAIRRALAVLRAYPELTKLRLTALVVTTTFVGYLMAAGGPRPLATLVWTIVGTTLAAAGSMALNQFLEASRDARMERTRHRPVPAGVLSPRHALVFGIAVAGAGIATLALGANTLTTLLGLAVVLIYALVYTPLKPRSPLCTLAGAVCGAIPPVMGWAATGRGLAFGAWLLAGVLFLWQIPHFLALAWLYREDYARGGFRMLPVVDSSGRTTAQMAVLYSLALLPVGIIAALGRMTGWGFAAASLVLGAGLVALSLALAVRKSDLVARRLFLATLAYLPLLLVLMVADRLPSPSVLALASAAGLR